jgi:hypothetical protein
MEASNVVDGMRSRYSFSEKWIGSSRSFFASDRRFARFLTCMSCLPEKKWMSIYVHWARLAACGHLGP